MAKKKLFRKAALDKLASPERLDELMEVTAPSGWIALAALGVVIFSSVLWGFFGSISIKVPGNGILMRGEAVRTISATGSGQLSEILVAPGDIVIEGQVVARISQPELVLRIENAREELARLDEETIIQQLESQAAGLREKVATQSSLVQRGLLTRGTLLNTQAQLASVEERISQQIARRQALESQVEELESRLAESGEVKSPYDGRVLELAADAGNMVGPGSRLFSLEALEGPIDAILYVPAREGKKIQEGMEARVSPSTVRVEEFGFILAEVKSVSVYPVTPAGISRVLRNEQLAQQLAGTGAQIEVKVSLIQDPETESGFRWTSSQGPPTKIFTGTLATALVVVEKKRPVSYVLPIFKEALGVA
jgi:HlyD family secretion protein